MTTPAQRTALTAAGFRVLAIPSSPCEACAFVTDSVSSVAGGSIEGGVLVCPGCATPRVLGSGLRLRAMSRCEYDALTAEELGQLEQLRGLHRMLPDYRGHDGTWPPPLET